MKTNNEDGEIGEKRVKNQKKKYLTKKLQKIVS